MIRRLAVRDHHLASLPPELPFAIDSLGPKATVLASQHIRAPQHPFFLGNLVHLVAGQQAALLPTRRTHVESMWLVVTSATSFSSDP